MNLVQNPLHRLWSIPPDRSSTAIGKHRFCAGMHNLYERKRRDALLQKNIFTFLRFCYAGATFAFYNGFVQLKGVIMNLFYYRLPSLGLGWGMTAVGTAQNVPARTSRYTSVRF